MQRFVLRSEDIFSVLRPSINITKMDSIFNHVFFVIDFTFVFLLLEHFILVFIFKLFLLIYSSCDPRASGE